MREQSRRAEQTGGCDEDPLRKHGVLPKPVSASARFNHNTRQKRILAQTACG